MRAEHFDSRCHAKQIEELSIVWTALHGSVLHVVDAVDWGFDGTARLAAT